MQEKSWYSEKWVGCQTAFSPSRYVKKDFLRPNVRFKKDFFPKSGKNRDFLAILEQFLGFYQFFFQHLA